MIRLQWQLVILGIAVLNCVAASAQPQAESESQVRELRVMTFNVLVDISLRPPIPPWVIRKDLCLRAVRDANPDIIVFEENSPYQFKFWKNSLPDYDSLGSVVLKPEEMRDIVGEFPILQLLGLETYTDVLIFFKKDMFDKLDEGHWWLSPTPEKVSRGFGNFTPRILIWAKLRHRLTGREFVVAGTHFDNTMPSQVEMARLSHELLQPFADNGLPMLFLGDFNTDQKRGDYSKLISDGWRDSYVVCPQASAEGRDDNVPTGPDKGDTRIDHIFYHGTMFAPVEWKRLESPDPSKLMSDHYPVFARFEMR